MTDWRARAIAAEAELHAMRPAYLDETHGDRDPETVGATQIRELRESSESWRTAVIAWQRWASETLTALGRQIDGGEWGDEQAARIISSEMAAMRKVVDAAVVLCTSPIAGLLRADSDLGAAVIAYRNRTRSHTP